MSEPTTTTTTRPRHDWRAKAVVHAMQVMRYGYAIKQVCVKLLVPNPNQPGRLMRLGDIEYMSPDKFDAWLREVRFHYAEVELTGTWFSPSRRDDLPDPSPATIRRWRKQARDRWGLPPE